MGQLSRHLARTVGASGLLLASAWLLSCCSDQIKIGQDFPLAAAGNTGSGGVLNIGGSAGSAGSANGGASAGSTACQITPCQGTVYACGDCTDNDGDGLVDSADPECTGPCDNTEDSYFGGIPGANNAPCHEDCYFDQDTGSGNDHCYWNQQCDPLSVAPDYPPSGDAKCSYDPTAKTPGTAASCADLGATQDPSCLAYCLPLTPNGCDCFGCCELPADSGHFVWLGSTTNNAGSCGAGSLSDPSACHPCTPVDSCFNSCDPCEVCVGRTATAAGCPSTGGVRCPSGLPACGQRGEPECSVGEYCITGCCVAAPK